MSANRSWITPFGFREVSNDFNAFGTNFARHLETAIVKWFNIHVIPSAKTKAPILTGTLRNALGVVQVINGPNMVSFVVGWGTRAEYGKFLERGTKFIEARQFMRRSIIEQTPQLNPMWVKQISVTEVDKYLQKGLKRFTFRP